MPSDRDGKSERLDRVVRALIQVPKSEIDAEEQKQRAEAKRIRRKRKSKG